MVSFTGSTRAGKRVSELASGNGEARRARAGRQVAVPDPRRRGLREGRPERRREGVPQQRPDVLRIDPDARAARAARRGGADRRRGRRALRAGRPDRGAVGDRAARLRRAARARARLHPHGDRGGRAARVRRRRAAGGPAAGLLRAPDDLLRRDARDDDRARGDLRPRARRSCPTTTRTTPCGSRTTRSTGSRPACGPRTPSAPSASPAACAPARSRSTAAQFDLRAPFGGFKQSGNGRENGRFGLEEYLEAKALLR